MKVAIINYGMSNLNSVRRAFEDLGAHPSIANNPSTLNEADAVVLPGVGSYNQGMENLRQGGWIEALEDIVVTQEKPLLGICLGMQLLSTSGHEGGVTQGLGIIPGRVLRLDLLGCELRIPHIGWNDVRYRYDDVLSKNLPADADFYFVHSYAFVPQSNHHVVATVSYGIDIAAVVRSGRVFGCQFHPEKSSKAGRQVLKNFLSTLSC